MVCTCMLLSLFCLFSWQSCPSYATRRIESALLLVFADRLQSLPDATCWFLSATHCENFQVTGLVSVAQQIPVFFIECTCAKGKFNELKWISGFTSLSLNVIDLSIPSWAASGVYGLHWAHLQDDNLQNRSPAQLSPAVSPLSTWTFLIRGIFLAHWISPIIWCDTDRKMKDLTAQAPIVQRLVFPHIPCPLPRGRSLCIVGGSPNSQSESWYITLPSFTALCVLGGDL